MNLKGISFLTTVYPTPICKCISKKMVLALTLVICVHECVYTCICGSEGLCVCVSSMVLPSLGLGSGWSSGQQPHTFTVFMHTHTVYRRRCLLHTHTHNTDIHICQSLSLSLSLSPTHTHTYFLQIVYSPAFSCSHTLSHSTLLCEKPQLLNQLQICPVNWYWHSLSYTYTHTHTH